MLPSHPPPPSHDVPAFLPLTPVLEQGSEHLEDVGFNYPGFPWVVFQQGIKILTYDEYSNRANKVDDIKVRGVRRLVRMPCIYPDK
ncbi:hypothetical protein BOTNAR_0013g00280 [Botryotinia narcissicola]|uniref:Uncharacterized protein n=1 Tax=Botryotinia narcissicola TaxID=278944 RepID=A0A4Z1J6N3_9HELO|nr:hypothetical protein BOTNAR_0013g00280 [Botryotinia narcissicola]